MRSLARCLSEQFSNEFGNHAYDMMWWAQVLAKTLYSVTFEHLPDMHSWRNALGVAICFCGSERFAFAFVGLIRPPRAHCLNVSDQGEIGAACVIARVLSVASPLAMAALHI